MPRFNIGDRVQLAGDIARFYACVVGVVAGSEKESSSALVQYTVRLADETIATFFDFQLQSPPAVRGQIVDTPGGEIHIVAPGVEVRLNMSGGPERLLTGHVSLAKAAACRGIVSLLIDGTAVVTKSTNDSGGFEFHETPGGDVMLETVVPGNRIVVPLSI
jgi:hypothetical protein